jgi:hypothetical protein
MASQSKSIRTTFLRNDWHLVLVHDLPSQSLPGDPNIDDPVNDTGLGPRHGDFQVSDEFASERRISRTQEN